MRVNTGCLGCQLLDELLRGSSDDLGEGGAVVGDTEQIADSAPEVHCGAPIAATSGA